MTCLHLVRLGYSVVSIRIISVRTNYFDNSKLLSKPLFKRTLQTTLKRFAGLLILNLFFASGYGQSYINIKGVVRDSISGKGINLATVQIYVQPQLEKPIQFTHSDSTGIFLIKNLVAGDYLIKASFVGYKEKHIALTVDSTTGIVEIMLQSFKGTLQGITVIARKPLIEQKDDRIIYNVESDPSAKAETAIDILRKTPFVNVDGEDNIQVNGKNNFKVLLNGRETAMFAQNIKEALRSFSGAIIVRIEIITAPSAKYDAEGIGGIINIVTKKSIAGYNGTLPFFANSAGFLNFNPTFSLKYGKVDIVMNYGSTFIPHQNNYFFYQSYFPLASSLKSRTLEGPGYRNSFTHFGNLELSLDLDSFNTVSFYGNVSGGRNKTVKEEILTTQPSASPAYNSSFYSNSQSITPTNTLGGDYIRKFRINSEKEFTLRIYREFGKSNSFLNSSLENPAPMPDRYVINNNIANNTQYTIQSDFLIPHKNSAKLEIGIKFILRNAWSDFESLKKTDANTEYKTDPLNSNIFNYKQNVYSSYSSYQLKFKNVLVRLGFRIEHTAIDGNFVSSQTFVKQNYTTLIPNFQSTFKIDTFHTLVFSYNKRLQRPFIANLNPFVINNDSMNITYGNPNLRPQTVHILSFQNRISKGKMFAGITISASYSGNSITSYSVFNESTNITSTTSSNIGREYQIILSKTFSNRFGDLTLNGNTNIIYARISSTNSEFKSNKGFGYNAAFNATYTVSKKVSLGSHFGLFKPTPTLQGIRNILPSYVFSFRYKMFSEKAILTIGIRNFMKQYFESKLVTNGINFENIVINRTPYRSFALGLSWNFGKLKEISSKRKGVNNDDLIKNN